MNRPYYETEETLTEEANMIDFVCSAWKCEAVKLPIKYGADYALMRDGKIAALAEMKDRYCESTIPRLIMSLDKFVKGKTFAAEIGVPFYAVFRFEDGITKWIRLDGGLFEVSISGRKDRQDPDDIEPCIWLPVSNMTDFK